MQIVYCIKLVLLCFWRLIQNLSRSKSPDIFCLFLPAVKDSVLSSSLGCFQAGQYLSFTLQAFTFCSSCSGNPLKSQPLQQLTIACMYLFQPEKPIYGSI